MSKIFHLLLSLDMGGLERGAVNLIRNSCPQNSHVICCLRDKGRFAVELPHGITVYALNEPGGNRLSTVRAIRALIRKEHADLIRCYNLESLFHAVPASWSLGIPVIYYNGGRTFPERHRRILAEKFLCNYVKRVAVPSDDLGRYMIEKVGISPKKMRVIENGIDPVRFESESNGNAKRMELGIGNGCRVLGTVGRLAPQKDHQTLFEAFSIIEKRIPESRLLVVGDGPLRQELEGLATRLNIIGKVFFLGLRTDVVELYRAMDLFLLTSRWEGFSNVVLEAMASRVPVICTRVEGMQRIIEDGKNGFLAEPGDAGTIAEKAILLLQDDQLSRTIRENGNRKVLEHFTISRMAREYEDLYEELLSRPL